MSTLLSSDAAAHFPAIYLVFAQCYGGLFADALQQGTNIPQKVHVVGLSNDSTISSINIDPNATVASAAEHSHLVEWLRNNFGNATSSPVEGQHGAGMGAMMGLAAGNLGDGAWADYLQTLNNEFNALDQM
jgi:hypothetical protein